jgi:hypothetical protein
VRIACSRIVFALAALGAAAPLHAAHPLLTEDTGTQGVGKFELELGVEQARDGGATALEFGPQLSWGALATLDLIARPTWLYVRGGAKGGTTQGFGDTALDFKWRFLDREPWSLGIRAGADVPTGNEDKSLGTGKTSPHATLIGTAAHEPWTFSANLDYVFEPLVGDRHDLWGASAAAVWSPHERWKFSAELGTAQNPDVSQST